MKNLKKTVNGIINLKSKKMIKIEVKPIREGKTSIGAIKTIRFFGIIVFTKKAYNVSPKEGDFWLPSI
ncbi:MAG: hypothetical protein PHP81_02980 [Patescibacteria group bacterium]|nr:hypothetical protein [Patescibacteria group bacterium]